MASSYRTHPVQDRAFARQYQYDLVYVHRLENMKHITEKDDGVNGEMCVHACLRACVRAGVRAYVL